MQILRYLKHNVWSEFRFWSVRWIYIFHILSHQYHHFTTLVFRLWIIERCTHIYTQSTCVPCLHRLKISVILKPAWVVFHLLTLSNGMYVPKTICSIRLISSHRHVLIRNFHYLYGEVRYTCFLPLSRGDVCPVLMKLTEVRDT